MKKFVSLILVMLLVLSMGAAFADQKEEVKSQDASFTSTYKITNAGAVSPAETFTYTFTAYDVKENSALEVKDMPAIADATAVFAKGDATTDGKSVTVDVALSSIEWPGVGEYYYHVNQTKGTTGGVEYDETEAFLKVTIAYDEVVGEYYTAFCTLSLDDDNEDGITDSKTAGFENEFDPGDLEITKTVTGNMGDKTKYFDVYVTLTGEEGKTYYGPYTVTGGSKETNPETIALGVKTTFAVKHGDTITISKLPKGVTYTVVEKDYTTSDGYDAAQYVFSDEDKKIDSDKDTVKIINNKGTVIDTGVIVDNLPYVAMLALVALAVVVMILKKRANND